MWLHPLVGGSTGPCCISIVKKSTHWDNLMLCLSPMKPIMLNKHASSRFNNGVFLGKVRSQHKIFVNVCALAGFELRNFK